MSLLKIAVGRAKTNPAFVWLLMATLADLLRLECSTLQTIQLKGHVRAHGIHFEAFSRCPVSLVAAKSSISFSNTNSKYELSH